MPISADAATAASTVLVLTSAGREATNASAKRRERDANATAIATPQRSDTGSVLLSSTAVRFKRSALATSGISARIASSALVFMVFQIERISNQRTQRSAPKWSGLHYRLQSHSRQAAGRTLK